MASRGARSGKATCFLAKQTKSRQVVGLILGRAVLHVELGEHDLGPSGDVAEADQVAQFVEKHPAPGGALAEPRSPVACDRGPGPRRRR